MKSKLVWLLVALVGATGFAMLALSRGEQVNAVWLVLAAVSCYAISYRFYSKFIAEKVFELDDRRMTPAERYNDGLDYVPTNKWVLFGHHFAAIAGAGPLVGPILAAQMGYLPGTIWILVGVMLAGAVQDFLVLFISTRRDGRSLGEIAKQELGPRAGVIVMLGALGVMVIILSALALIVVKALAESPWGTFTIAATIPIALFMGIYMRFIRPGRIAEISVIGFVLMMAAIVYGEDIARSEYWGPLFTLTGPQLTLALVVYGFVASVLPVWLLLAPRDYLSTVLTIGTIALLAIAIFFSAPYLQMPAVTKFIDGSGPVWSGGLFPFLFITIACGAVSGFHALIASGTTPKLIASEGDAPFIGYGAMLMESFVAIMALVAASVIEPGIYFAMNAPPAVVGSDVVAVAAKVSEWGFAVSPEMLTATAADIGEHSILSRAGGAPTLAVGIAQILHAALPVGDGAMAFWYHFAILFEALFILTAVDAGTRAGRFMLQDLLGSFVPALRRTEAWGPNLLATGGCVALWGYFLYQGVTDPLGGINMLWPLFGIANQMLAGIALMLCTVVLFKMKKDRYAWVSIVPTAWLLVCTVSAGFIKLFDSNPAVGFLAQANRYRAAIQAGELIAPSKDMGGMHQIMFNNYVNAGLTALFLLVVLSVLFYSILAILKARRSPARTDRETPYVALTEEQQKAWL